MLVGYFTMLALEVREGAIVFSVRVQPRASRDAIEGVRNGALLVRLTAPPLDDRANDACRRVLADHLGVPASAIRILSGERSRTKRVEARGVGAEAVRRLAESAGKK
jgi:uncharacterized protein (TIGR00251 family)